MPVGTAAADHPGRSGRGALPDRLHGMLPGKLVWQVRLKVEQFFQQGLILFLFAFLRLFIV